MNLQPSEFIAKTHITGDYDPQRIATYNMAPALSYASGAASSCLSMPQRGLTNTNTDTGTNTNTDKENNND